MLLQDGSVSPTDIFWFDSHVKCGATISTEAFVGTLEKMTWGNIVSSEAGHEARVQIHVNDQVVPAYVSSESSGQVAIDVVGIYRITNPNGTVESRIGFINRASPGNVVFTLNEHTLHLKDGKLELPTTGARGFAFVGEHLEENEKDDMAENYQQFLKEGVFVLDKIVGSKTRSTSVETVKRAFSEEFSASASIDGGTFYYLGVHDRPGRDSRYWTFSHPCWTFSHPCWKFSHPCWKFSQSVMETLIENEPYVMIRYGYERKSLSHIILLTIDISSNGDVPVSDPTDTKEVANGVFVDLWQALDAFKVGGSLAPGFESHPEILLCAAYFYDTESTVRVLTERFLSRKNAFVANLIS